MRSWEEDDSNARRDKPPLRCRWNPRVIWQHRRGERAALTWAKRISIGVVAGWSGGLVLILFVSALDRYVS